MTAQKKKSQRRRGEAAGGVRLHSRARALGACCFSHFLPFILVFSQTLNPHTSRSYALMTDKNEHKRISFKTTMTNPTTAQIQSYIFLQLHLLQPASLQPFHQGQCSSCFAAPSFSLSMLNLCVLPLNRSTPLISQPFTQKIRNGKRKPRQKPERNTGK